MVQADVHGGFTEKDVLQKVAEARETARRVAPNKVWLFFDEINTAAEVVGLFKEIVCDRHCLGDPLPHNIIVLAASNPYRERVDSSEDCVAADAHSVDPGLSQSPAGAIGVDRHRLVYDVVPLPATIASYRWRFGCIATEDEKLYIAEMVFQELDVSKETQQSLIAGICCAHRFLRRCYGDVSAVSLRDTVRCIRFFKWFASHSTADRVVGFSRTTRDVCLALAQTYYFRLRASRSRFSHELDRCLGLAEGDFERILELCISAFMSCLEIPRGVACNSALRENVFVSMACIQTKVPVVVVGSPGCSKTLSMQLLFRHSHLLSNRETGFRRMIPVAFQCSKLSTAAAIEKRFQYAAEFQQSQGGNDALAVLWLDEIGLAEQSRHRPLKVLHRLLENPDVSFVGLSNWRLDAAKMNRVVLHCCPALDHEALQQTAVAIVESMHDGDGGVVATSPRSRNSCRVDAQLLKVIDQVVSAYIDIAKQQPYQDFFGKRDFYSTVQILSRSSLDVDGISASIQHAFERNFGGLERRHSFIDEVMLEHFGAYYTRQQLLASRSSPLSLIRVSLGDYGGDSGALQPRHIMCLSSDKFMWKHLLEAGTFGDPSSVCVLVGSEFSGDQSSSLSVYERNSITCLIPINPSIHPDLRLHLRLYPRYQSFPSMHAERRFGVVGQMRGSLWLVVCMSQSPIHILC